MTLLIRADARASSGMGHLMRCLALAQAWQDTGGNVHFIIDESNSGLCDRIRAQGFEVEHPPTNATPVQDASFVKSRAVENNVSWIVVDGYQFDTAYLQSVKESDARLLIIDDLCQFGPCGADVILNQNPQVCASAYGSQSEGTKFLLGSRYALLRREFVAERSSARAFRQPGKNVLIMMGGSDQHNVAERVLKALVDIKPEFSITVVLGANNGHAGVLAKACPGCNLRVVRDPDNMAELMSWADLAISAAGTTAWEMCCLGLPAILIDVAENQIPVGCFLNDAGAAIYLGNYARITPEQLTDAVMQLSGSASRREHMYQIGRALVDGEGAWRAQKLLACADYLRKASLDDCQLLWRWANQPEIRAASFNSHPIAWDEHVHWFNQKLQDRNVLFYLGKDNELQGAIGYARFSLEDRRAILSIGIDAECRGKGLGRRLLSLATESAFAESEVDFIDAYVKPQNAASIRLFSHAGFQRADVANIAGQQAIRFTLPRTGRCA